MSNDTLGQHPVLNTQSSSVLTGEQKSVLKFIVEYVEDHTVFPTVATICESRGRKSKGNIRRILHELERNGYVISNRFGERIRTGWLLTEKAKRLGRKSWPLLGVIPAGPLQEALEEAPNVVSYLSDILHMKSDDFVIRVTGDWMLDHGIRPGDHVQISPTDNYTSKDIMAVRYQRRDIYLKHIVVAGKKLRLLSANAADPPIECFVEDLVVLGRVTALLSTTQYRLG